MKQIGCMVLAIALVFGLAGCGGGMAGGYESVPTSIAAPAPGDGAPAEGGNADACWEEAPEEWLAEEEDWRYAPLDPSEEYDDSPETPFKNVLSSPLSTFSSDVDTASYSNLRRMLVNGQMPEGVRIEELVNYFTYDYKRPGKADEHPFAITTEVAPCPWNPDNQLAMIGIQAAQISNSEGIANNIVFLLDVSGSMSSANKLPLLQESFKLLVDQLDEKDTISIVTYAGSDQIIADSVAGNKHSKLKRLIDGLYAGGSTAGAKGLETAYQLAEENYIEDGNNRIILATDGDFNVGQSSDADMTDLIENQRDKGIFISVLGFGMGNLKDSKMERIADHGNGNYAYIDNIEEARKVLVDEFDSTMFTIAKDMKIQVVFNPAVVAQYRLIGYNNRRLENEDFANDQKDAGDVGAGHSVTAFYELVMANGDAPAQNELVYQTMELTDSDDYMMVRVRYKQPDEDESKLVEQRVGTQSYSEALSPNFAFASAVAEFGLLVSQSQYKGGSNTGAVIERAQPYANEDEYGFRQEFINLVRVYEELLD